MKLTSIDGGAGVPPEPNWRVELPGRWDGATAERRAASAYWREAIGELRENEKLAFVNGHALKRLVIAYVLFDRAARQVATMQPVIAAPRTKTAMHNPWTTVMAQCDRMAAQLEAELTLSPRRRSAGGKVTRRRRTTAADTYLKPVPKA